MTEPPVSLELTDVGLSRGGRRLTAGLSCRLEAGQLGLLTGPNGSGKTTLLRTIAGLAPAAEGTVRSCGRITYQAHQEGLKKDLTVEENIRFIKKLNYYSDSDSKFFGELDLDRFRHRMVRHLSAGQKRRVMLAVLACSGAGIWLLDEPLTNLDTAGRDLVARWLDRHLAQGGLALVATHLSQALERPNCLLVEL